MSSPEGQTRNDRQKHGLLVIWPLLLLLLVALTGYVVWQVAPLTSRMDAIERDHLKTKDEVSAETDAIRREVASLRRPLVVAFQGDRRSPLTTSGPLEAANPSTINPPSASADQPQRRPLMRPPAFTEPSIDAPAVFRNRLFPTDATIAEFMYQRVPIEEIAHRLNHSVPFVLAKAKKIQNTLAAAPDTPPQLLRAMRNYLDDAER